MHFCVQRLQEGKLNAKKEDRPLKDLEVKTACMQACPTHAIMFGNVNDKESKISQLRYEEQKERKFYVLEELHVLSNVNYLAKVRIDEATRVRMADAARLACTGCGYRNAGTVEFPLDRGRVVLLHRDEHPAAGRAPVSELVTGRDLAAWQLRIAGGDRSTRPGLPPPRPRHRVPDQLRGPRHDFRPATVMISASGAPLGPGVRFDTHSTRAIACRRSTTRCWRS